MSKLRTIRLLVKHTNLKIAPLIIAVTFSSVLGGLLVYAFAPFVSIVLIGNEPSAFQQIELIAYQIGFRYGDFTVQYILGITLILVAFFNGIAQIFRLKLFNTFCQGIVEKLSNIFFKNYLISDYSSIKMIDSKKLENLILTETYQIMNYFVRPMVEIISAITALTAILLAMILVDFRILYLLVLLSSALICVYYLVRKQFLLLGTERQESQESKHLILNESFQSYKDIRYYEQESLLISRFNLITNTIKKSEVFANVGAELPKLVLEALVPMGVVFFGLYSLINFENQNGEALTTISVLALGLVKMLPDVSRAYRSISLIQFSDPICNLIINELSNSPDDSAKKTNAERYNLKKSIELRNLEFSFNDQKPMFKPVNVNINKGDKVAVVGPSGIGKSTLLDLISGLLRPTKGSILIDSVDLNSIQPCDWLTNFAYVPQEILLMDTSVYENITFRTDLDPLEAEEVNTLIKELNLKDLMSDRENFTVGNRGQKISGGQRQRIAIARALFFKRDIIIMDEPTSALDNQNTQEIINFIFNKSHDKTIFVITHDAALLKKFDKIIALEK